MPFSHGSNSSNVQEYQVDNIRTLPYRDSDSDDGTEDAIVVSCENSFPRIESVSVVNSNEVHIGNKTVFQGPVTIKQLIYPNGALSAECVNNLKNGENTVAGTLNGSPTAHGVDNPSYEKDNSIEHKDESNNDGDIVENNDARHTFTGIKKGFLWPHNFIKKHTTGIVIFFCALIVVIIIIVTFTYWRQPLPLVNDVYTDEQNNYTPQDYASDYNSTMSRRLRMVPRLQWLAQPPTHEADELKTPVPLVVIQQTNTASCKILPDCIYNVRQIQQYHIESKQWWDIGYNFLIGGDGAAYEARGWKYQGAHTYNYKSISVAFVGTFNTQVPSESQIVAFKKLVDKGVTLGYIQKDYKILGAPQPDGTESPGAAFLKEMETWPHWSKQP